MEVLGPHLEGRDGERGEMRVEIAAAVPPRSQVRPATQAERPGRRLVQRITGDLLDERARFEPAPDLDRGAARRHRHGEGAVDIVPLFAKLADVLVLARNLEVPAVHVHQRDARRHGGPGRIVDDERRERPGGARGGAGVGHTQPGQGGETKDEQPQGDRPAATGNGCHDGLR